MTARLALLLGVLALAPGCATISGTSNQQLAVATKGSDGKAIEGAN